MNTINQIKDIVLPKKLLNNIINEVCWEAGISYGDELVLELGEKIPKENLLAGCCEGSWSVTSRSSMWNLSFQSSLIASSEQNIDDIIKEKIKIIEGKSVTGIDIIYPSLALSLFMSTDYHLLIQSVEEDNEYDMPYWEIYLPENMLFQMGPNRKWFYGNLDDLD